MKRNILFLIVFILPGISSAANWAEDWFDNSVSTPSSSFDGQKRGFYNAPGFSGRVHVATDNPITVTTPKIEAGCGGIDMFLGGVSFLDEDYLVQKFQNIMQAAPAVAFDMALKTMCKECSETITKLEAAANWLNGLQMNECAMSKKLVATVSEGDPNVLKPMWGEMTSGVSLGQAIDRSWTEAQENVRANDGKPTQDLKALTDQCPADFKAIFQDGSLIHHVSDRVGLTDYEDTIRGFLGDVFIKAGNTDLIPTAYEIPPCSENEGMTVKDMLEGNVYDQSVSQTCSKSAGKSVRDIVTDRMTDLVDNMKNNQPQPAEVANFINTSGHIPVYAILRKAVIKNNEAAQISVLQDVVGTTYSAHILNDLYRNISVAMNEVRKASSPIGASGTAGQCDPRIYSGAMSKFENLHKRLREQIYALNEHYRNQIASYSAGLMAANYHEEDAVRSQNSKPNQLGK